jgi:hypothetical protein
MRPDVEVESPVTSGTWEHTVEFTAKVPIRWTWESAESISSVGPADRAEMVAQLKLLGSSLEKKDCETYDHLYSAHIKGLAKVRGVTPDIVARESDQKMLALLNAPFSVEFNQKGLLFFPRGRIVDVRLADNQPILRIAPRNPPLPGGLEFLGYDSFLFGKFKGKWVILK